MADTRWNGHGNAMLAAGVASKYPINKMLNVV